MNWKPALIGALVVMLVGAGVGYAVDRTDHAKSTTVTRTVAITITVPGASTVASGTGTTTTTTTTATTSPASTAATVPVSGRVQYLAEQSSDTLDSSNLSINAPPTATIGHSSFENAVTVDSLWESDCSQPATIEYPVSSGTATFVASVGWTQDSDSSAAAVFEVRANTIDGDRLYRRVFDGPGEPVKLVLPLRGAIKAILVWRRTDNSCSSLSATFAMGEARFVG
jgi:hypothetical protein